MRIAQRLDRAHRVPATLTRWPQGALRRLRGFRVARLEARAPRPPEPSSSDPEYRLLFVCHGNILRSAIAQGILRNKLSAVGLLGRVAVDSAGTSDVNAGRQPDPRARLAVLRGGAGIPDLRARAFTDEDFQTFDLILVMDDQNRRDLLARARTSEEAAKVRRFLDCTGGGGEIHDPVHFRAEQFHRVCASIDRGCDALLEMIASDLGVPGAGPAAALS